MYRMFIFAGILATLSACSNHANPSSQGSSLESFGSLECDNQARIEISDFSEITSFDDFGYMKDKAKIVKDEFGGKFVDRMVGLNLIRKTANGHSRSCVYDAGDQYKVALISSNAGRRLQISKDFKMSSDSELSVYKSILEVDAEISSKMKSAKSEVNFGFNYDYSCGFADCTVSDRGIRSLGSAKIAITKK